MRDGLTLWRNARLATCDDTMRTIDPGALLTRGGRIEWAGEETALPAGGLRGPGDRPTEVHDLGRAWVTPGLIDCHTHLVFAGTRATEYAERLRGVPYEEIARRGGGILSTMRAVRAASEEELFMASAPRMEALRREGCTTIEIKSGYGLTLADEAKMLRVARRLGQTFPVTVKATLLAAHTVPPEYEGRAAQYIDVICREWLPALHSEGLVDAVDVFCDAIGFDTAQSQRLIEAADARGIPVKMHAEQLTNIGATRLGTRYRALSCDHLEHATEADVQALAAAGSVAVLLPIAFYCLAGTRKPPVEALRRAGARMAIATDCNPGSAPSASLLLAMNMATRLFDLTAEEALAAVTRNASRALGEHTERGTLGAGQAADFVCWEVESIAELSYWIGFKPPHRVVRGGKLVT